MKCSYDFRRPQWLTYGHVLFVDAGATEADARAAIHRDEGADVTITRVELRAATVAERQRFEDQKARMAQWLRQTRDGISNRRGDL